MVLPAHAARLLAAGEMVVFDRDSTWWEVDADVKRRARLNCNTHLLRQVPYEPVQ